MSARDIIVAVIEAFMRNDDSITEELALTVEREVRDEWAGIRPAQISRESTRLKRAREERVLKDVLDPAVQTSEILNRHGISRASMYRLLKRGPAKADDK